LNVGVGFPVAVTVKVPADPTAKVALFAEVIAGAWDVPAYESGAVKKNVLGEMLLWNWTTRSHWCVESHCRANGPSPSSLNQVTEPMPALKFSEPDVALLKAANVSKSPAPSGPLAKTGEFWSKHSWPWKPKVKVSMTGAAGGLSMQMCAR